MQDKNETTIHKDINISSLKYSFKNMRHTFELMQIETQSSNNVKLEMNIDIDIDIDHTQS